MRHLHAGEAAGYHVQTVGVDLRERTRIEVASDARCSPPFSCPGAPPASTIGSGLKLCWLRVWFQIGDTRLGLEQVAAGQKPHIEHFRWRRSIAGR
jgi:hypothetical protein